MNQTLHIFKKDTRRFWIEILVLMILLAVYCVDYPTRWHWTFGEPSTASQVMNTLVLLIPAAWWLLIARVIHTEALVGENQFWLTRPYQWKNLLAAKVLFVFAWIYVPFALAQAAMLKQAGFSPLSHADAWLAWLLTFTGYVFLPLCAIAALTANFARMTLTLLGALGVLVATLIVATKPNGWYESAVPNTHFFLIPLVLLIGAAVVLLVQYATRRVWLARGIAVGTVLLAAGVALGLLALRQGEVSRQYPAASSSAESPVQVAYASDARSLRTTPSERPGMVYMDVPVTLSGVAPGTAVQIDDVKITLQAADGSSWTSPWWTSRQFRFLPGTHDAELATMLPRQEYDRFQSAPATIHLTLAVTELHAGSEATVPLGVDDFAVGNFGVCTTQMMWRFPTQLICRAAWGKAPLTYFSAHWSRTPCSDPQPDPATLPTAGSWAGEAYSAPQPVQAVIPRLIDLYPHLNGHGVQSTYGIALCMGTPVHFTSYTVARRSQASMTSPSVTLPPATFRRN